MLPERERLRGRDSRTDSQEVALPPLAWRYIPTQRLTSRQNVQLASRSGASGSGRTSRRQVEGCDGQSVQRRSFLGIKPRRITDGQDCCRSGRVEAISKEVPLRV